MVDFTEEYFSLPPSITEMSENLALTLSSMVGSSMVENGNDHPKTLMLKDALNEAKVVMRYIREAESLRQRDVALWPNNQIKINLQQD